MAKHELPSPEFLRQLLRYEPATGKLFWRSRSEDLFADCVRPVHAHATWNAQYAGKEALATATANNHLEGQIFYQHMYAHRAIWAIVYGKWPDGQIDHINGNGLDNRLSNLRDVSQIDNQRNMKRFSSNKSGVTGVYWDGSKRRWCATICLDGKATSLGRFVNFDDAVNARKEGEKLFGFHPNHGRS